MTAIKHTWSWFLPEADNYFASHLTAQGFDIYKLDKALTYCSNFGLAIDGGSHIGTWAIHMAKKFKKVIAFEPCADSYECLMKNLQMHHIGNVEPVNAALADVSGRCTMLGDASRKGNTGARIAAFAPDAKTPVKSIDSLHCPTVGFIKLDIEGSELRALTGAFETIRRCRPILLVECKYSELELLNFLDGMGYKELGGRKEDRVFGPR